MEHSVDLILFDLGGVLVELGENGPVNEAWLPNDGEFNLADWFASETAIQFEKGLVDAQVFAKAFKKELNINASSEQIIAHFTAWPTGLFTGANKFLSSLTKQYKLAVLSNSNELHWHRITNDFGINEQYFDTVFASHELKMAKPNADIYQHVIQELNVKPENILFVDDNSSNIAAAKKLGINAHQVQGLTSVIELFTRLKLIKE